MSKRKPGEKFMLSSGELVISKHCTKTACCSLCDFQKGYNCGLKHDKNFSCSDEIGVNYYLKKVN